MYSDQVEDEHQNLISAIRGDRKEEEEKKHAECKK